MQVRAIEFQESFARVPVEGARQQNLIQRLPDETMRQTAGLMDQQRLLDLTRPGMATSVENPIVDASSGGNRRDRRRGESRDPGAAERPPQASDAKAATSTGRHVDFVV